MTCFRPQSFTDRYGYIPLNDSDPHVHTEAIRQIGLGLVPCLCSNCNPKAAQYFVAQQKVLTTGNFTELVRRDQSLPLDSLADCEDHLPRVSSQLARIIVSDRSDRLRHDLRRIRLFLMIRLRLQEIFEAEYPGECFYTLPDLFSDEKVWSVCVNYSIFLEGITLNDIFGSEPLDTSYDAMLDCIKTWRSSRDFVAILHPTSEELAMQQKAQSEALDHQSGLQMLKEARAKKARETRLANMNLVSIYHCLSKGLNNNMKCTLWFL